MTLVPIRYVGSKPRRTDSVARTGLVWGPGEVHEVPAHAAQLLLRHPDVWAIEGGGRAPAVFEEPETDEEREAIELAEMPRVGLPNITTMTRAALANLALSRFGIALDAAKTPAEMRAEIVALENGGRQRGQ